MKRVSVLLLAMLLFAGLVSVAPNAGAADSIPGWKEKLRGVQISFPESDWKITYEDVDKRQSVKAECISAECEQLQHECFFSVPDDYMGLNPLDGVAFFPFTLGAKEVRSEILEYSGDGAKITREMHFETHAGQVWWTGESLSPYGWKSAMQAFTVVNGRFILFRCQSCGREENKFNFMRDLMKTVKLSATAKLAARIETED